ncbi:hypothetical protein [Streptomyces sp. cmx-18-6]|uniref:hypothetical protein n=1 Tax=Streptomyces sp. cmx-18-6 TaxID=2790930 RepID=UPI0039800A61
MADERNEWLDKDAAEKLLRGEPVVPLGDRAASDARRLAEALGAARVGHRAPAGALPGEEAVLTAFRQAAHGNRTDRLAGRNAGAALPGRPGTLHAVHIGAAPATPLRRPRWSRPVRFGLAVSLAGCALGGVAVAAGTGIFPGSFGSQGAPAPATSVSAAVPPEPPTSGQPADDPPSPVDSPPPGDPDPLASPGSREPGASGEPAEPSPGSTGPETGEDDPGDRARERPKASGRENASRSPTGRENRPGGSGDGRGSGGNWYEKSAKACKAFRDGTLDERSRRQLIQLAKGEQNVQRFCDRLLGGGNGPGSGKDDGKGDGKDGGHGEGPREGDGDPLPPVSFQPAPPPHADRGRRGEMGVRPEADGHNRRGDACVRSEAGSGDRRGGADVRSQAGGGDRRGSADVRSQAGRGDRRGGADVRSQVGGGDRRGDVGVRSQGGGAAKPLWPSLSPTASAPAAVLAR